MQDTGAGFQFPDDCQIFRVDYLDRVVIRDREIDPDMPVVGMSHDENGLSMDGNTSDLLPVFGVNHENFVATDGGYKCAFPRNRPAFKMGHFVNG